jgi:hypothetical protein
MYRTVPSQATFQIVPCLLTHHVSFFIIVIIIRLTKELVEAKKKMDDKSIDKDKKTFLKAQMPKLEAEIKTEREAVLGLLDEDELDPRGEFYLMAKKLTKGK